ncbi:MAG: serine hydrolase domain-containing protein [Pseudomonadota bacterium]
MVRIFSLPLFLFSVVSCASVSEVPPPVAQAVLDADAAKILDETVIPAIAIGVTSCASGAVAVDGVARAGSPTPVADDARFNIGSNGKSMLASVAMRLEEKGVLRLSDPLADLWPKAAEAHPDKASITLGQLLAHRSGLPAFSSGQELRAVPEFSGSDAAIREQAALYFLAAPLASEPGTASVYSNAGFVVAGALLEQVTGKELGALLSDEVFGPLALRSARLSVPTDRPEGQPFGHLLENDQPVPFDDPEGAIPIFLEAAGNIELTAEDYVSYLRGHLCALRGESRWLSKDAAERLHGQVAGSGLALGWAVTELGGSTISYHIGGTGEFTAYMAVSADQDRAALAMVNLGGAPAQAAFAWLREAITPSVSVAQ